MRHSEVTPEGAVSGKVIVESFRAGPGDVGLDTTQLRFIAYTPDGKREDLDGESLAPFPRGYARRDGSVHVLVCRRGERTPPVSPPKEGARVEDVSEDELVTAVRRLCLGDTGVFVCWF